MVLMKPLRTLRIAACAIVAVTICAAAGAKAASGSGPVTSVSVPAEIHGVHFVVPVTINGKPARMLVDTGADQTVFGVQAAKRLGLRGGSKPIAGAGASAKYTAAQTTIDDIAVGSFHLRKHPAYIVPTPDEFTYDGVLGTPFIASYVTTLDYQRKVLSLQARDSFVPPAGVTPLAARFEGGKLVVMATAAGVEGWYSVDSGAGNALTFFTPAVESHHLRTAFSPSVRTVTGMSVGGATRGDLVRIPEVRIGTHVFSGVVAELSLAEQGFFANNLFAGNLGGEIWRRFSVTLDYGHGQVYLQPNDAIAEPFRGPSAGFTPAIVDGVVKVVDVIADSPAAQAGLRSGDALLALNGNPLDVGSPAAISASLEGLQAALHAEPGTRMALRVADAASAPREVVVTLRDLL